MIIGPLLEKRKYKIRPNKKMPVLRVTRPYLNLLVKPRSFFRFSGKNRIYIFFKKKKIKKIVCLPYLKFPEPSLETHLYFYLAS